MAALTELSLTEARDALRTKQITAVELTKAYLAAMERHRD
jgi:aspartyl-tRNA(Asn)/glutamyl-tRNA(Gln) amidotransferase subunit A